MAVGVRDPKSVCKHPEYVNFQSGVIGLTSATRQLPNTANEFYFWLEEGEERVQLGNIVAVVQEETGEVTFGEVVEINSYMEIDDFLSDYLTHGGHALTDGREVNLVQVAKAVVIKSTDERIKPVGRGWVYFASAEGISFGVGMSDYAEAGTGIPVGVLENGDGTIVPVLLDQDFLIGPEGAHLNMAGISGLATKTSLIEFLLKSIFDTLVKSGKLRIAAIFFNVKGQDLLYLDKPNPQYEEHDPYTEWCRSLYDILGIELAPFENVRIFAPYDPHFEGHTKSFRRDGKVEYFIWELPDLIDDIPELFSEDEWTEAVEAVWIDIKEQIERQPLRTYDELMEWLNEERRALTSSKQQYWRGHEKEAFYRCFKNLDALAGLYDGLVCTGGVEPVDIPLHDLYNGTVFVIDIQSLNRRGQAMVFNKILNRIYRMLIDKNIEKDFDKVIFFVDELNKFAPRESSRKAPLKESIIEVCARGRSIGVTFFGVEQFMSQIDRQVVDNSSTIIFGRTGPGELGTDNYQWLPRDIRARLTQLPRGMFLLKHAKFVEPIFVRFPYPTCVPGDRYIPEEKEEREVSAFDFRRQL